MARYNPQTDGISFKLSKIKLLEKRDVNVSPFRKGEDEISYILITTDGGEPRIVPSNGYFSMEKDEERSVGDLIYHGRPLQHGRGPVAYDLRFFEVQKKGNFGSTVNGILKSQGTQISALVGTANPAAGVITKIATDTAQIIIKALNGPKQVAHISGLLENLSGDPYKTVTREWKQKANAIRATFVCDVVQDLVQPRR